MFARRYVSAAQFVQAPGRDEVGQAVHAENAGDAGVVIGEADQRSGEQHAGLYADNHRSVGAGELAGGNDFLHQRVDVGPVHGGAGADNQRDEIEVPEFEVAAPRNVRCGEDGDTTGEIQYDAEVAAVVAVDQHAADERNQQARRGRHNHLIADLDGRVR